MDESTRNAHITALTLCRLFQNLPVEDLAPLAAFVEFRQVEKGTMLFREGEISSGFFLVQSGAVSINRSGPDGREKVIHVFREGDSFGEATLADRTGYPANAHAISPCRLVFVPRDPFLGLIRERPEFAMRILASISQHLRQLVDAVDHMNHRDLETRLGYWLLRRCPQPRTQDAVDFSLGISKSALAAELHVRQESLSRVLQRWKNAELIKTSGRHMIVLNPLALEAAIQDRMNS